jgi:hypothetical protein
MTEIARAFSFPHAVNAQEKILEAWRENRDLELETDMRLWCIRNVDPNDWLHDPAHRYEFRSIEDAVRFQLTWL